MQDKHPVMLYDFFTNTFARSVILGHSLNQICFILMQVQTFYITLQISSWDDYFYDLAARNSIDVGEFVGRCLAGVIQQ